MLTLAVGDLNCSVTQWADLHRKFLQDLQGSLTPVSVVTRDIQIWSQ
jgi:hypothetical protein